MGMPEKDAITQMIESAEANLISTTPGAVPPHVDDGGHLPFGGQVGGTRGPSAFGKRKMTRANAIGNPQALLLNYPPENTESTLQCWERNCARALPELSPSCFFGSASDRSPYLSPPAHQRSLWLASPVPPPHPCISLPP